MKKILIITSIHPDFDQRIWKHCNSLKCLGYNVTLLCQWDSIHNTQVVDGIEIINYGNSGNRRFRMFKNNFKLLFMLIKLKKFDLYHFHDIDILPLMTLWSSFNNVVYDIHENYPEEMLERYWIPVYLRKPLFYLVWFYQYWSVKLIRNIVLVVESQKKNLPSDVNYIYIYNYASRKTYNIQEELKKEYEFITTASQYKENGIETLLESVKLFKNDGKKIKVAVMNRFTSDEYRTLIMSKINAFDLTDYIEIVDKVLPHDLPLVLLKARIGLVLDLDTPRRRMAIPTKIFEYFASGLLVVGSKLPNTERFISNEFGVLFDPGDSISLYKAMSYSLEIKIDSFEIREMFNDNYSWESQDKKYMEFYNSIIL